MALENSNTNMSAPTWSWIQAWLVCPSHHATLAVVFASATAHFSFYVSLILSHSFESICVNLCLSGILVGNYLCPFKILIGIISVYSRYSHHPYHLNCSVWSASRESPHLQSICVITHLSTIEFIFQAHKFVSMEGDFQCSEASGVGILEWLKVSSWGADQFQSCQRFPGVELGRGDFERVCWRFRRSVWAPHSGECILVWQC